MHYIAPIPIIFGVVGAIIGLLWIVALGSEDDGGPISLHLLGATYLVYRMVKQFSVDPVSVLIPLGILLVSGGLIWLGIIML